jgi:hypothetical protein
MTVRNGTEREKGRKGEMGRRGAFGVRSPRVASAKVPESGFSEEEEKSAE